MNEDSHDNCLAGRTKSFAVRIIKLYSSLPKSTEAQVIGRQLIRSGTSPGAHYREGSRARSTAEFISKLEVGIQELEETKYWLELLVECSIVTVNRLRDLMTEADEWTAMLVASVRTAKNNMRK